jgi:hypothetical protein
MKGLMMKKEDVLKDLFDTVDKLLNKVDRLRKGYDILIEHWDSFPDEEKPKIDKKLRKLGL